MQHISKTHEEIICQQENELLKHEIQRLQLENKAQKILTELDAHNRFKKLAHKVVHDLATPLLVLAAATAECIEVPVKQRDLIRNSLTMIKEVASSLNHYASQVLDSTQESALLKHELLVSVALDQLRWASQIKYTNLRITFRVEYMPEDTFVFIDADNVLFNHMVSTVLDNAIEAIGYNYGDIGINLVSELDKVNINITASGDGMSQEMINKVMQNVTYATDKANEHNEMGLQQIGQIMAKSGGQLNINTKLEKGTTITLTFPKIATPDWIAQIIELRLDSIVIILDCDDWVHKSWDTHFKKFAPDTIPHYFTDGSETVRFINNLDAAEKDKVVLLTDYEWKPQQLHGLEVIHQTGITNAILITHEYNNPQIRAWAKLKNIKILPSLLTTKIPINIS